jgi:hypothetical protein
VRGAQDAVLSAAEEMKKGGMLQQRTDVTALAKKAFVRLDGVTDEWLDAVAVEKLPEGEGWWRADVARLTSVLRTSPLPGCCRGNTR